MKMGLLFKHRSNPSPMEGETSKRKAYQGGKMDAASEKFFMQKMLECEEVQAEVLKKIISHLSKIEKEEAENTRVIMNQDLRRHQLHDGRRESLPTSTPLQVVTKGCSGTMDFQEGPCQQLFRIRRRRIVGRS